MCSSSKTKFSRKILPLSVYIYILCESFFGMLFLNVWNRCFFIHIQIKILNNELSQNFKLLRYCEKNNPPLFTHIGLRNSTEGTRPQYRTLQSLLLNYEFCAKALTLHFHPQIFGPSSSYHSKPKLLFHLLSHIDDYLVYFAEIQLKYIDMGKTKMTLCRISFSLFDSLGVIKTLFGTSSSLSSELEISPILFLSSTFFLNVFMLFLLQNLNPYIQAVTHNSR